MEVYLSDDRYALLKPLLERREGRHNKAYRDSKGIDTVGIGSSLRSPDTVNFMKSNDIPIEDVRSGKRILSDDEVDRLYNHNVAEKERYMPKGELSDNQASSLMSQLINAPELVGPNMRKAIAAGDHTGVLNEMVHRSNRRGSPGVQSRRMEEAKMYAGENWDDYANSISDKELKRSFGRLYRIKNKHSREEALNRFPGLRKRFESLYKGKK